MSLYELAILGDVSPQDRLALIDTVGAMLADAGLALGTDLVIRDGDSVARRDRYAACAAAYFCGGSDADSAAAKQLAKESVPVIPVLTADSASCAPVFLREFNGLRLQRNDKAMVDLASALLECVGLLRRQRRIFVSYRRAEARAAAVQVHDLLTARGCEVFLDTHSLRPGDRFRDILWQRLCDCDLVVMLETPTFFESEWTRNEMGRANAKGIAMLRLVWPGLEPDESRVLANSILLDREDLEGADGPFAEAAARKIVLAAERLRSQAISARHLSIAGQLRSTLERIGIVEGIGAHRAFAVRLRDNRRIWAYPVVGVPTAETLNDIAEKARRADQQETPALVYDHVGISDAWNAHLKWLDENIRTVKAVRVSEAAWSLAAWEKQP